MNPTTTNQRLLSLDAFRGFIMLLMASSGFGIVQMAAANPGSAWEFVMPQFAHQAWQGCSLWDLIQPSFMFMVGMSVPFSYAKRREHGQGFFGMAWHALTRSILLVALGVMLATKAGDKHTVFLFTNVLAQIGLGYFVLFLLTRLGWEYLMAWIILILAGYSWFFIQHPLPSPEDLAAIAGMKDVEQGILPGFAGHWNIHTNAAAAFDRWFLNQLPQAQPYQFTSGGYQTLNFVPALATMMLGALTGCFLMRSSKTEKGKWAALLIMGLVLVVVGTALDVKVLPVIGAKFDQYTLLPVVKRIWTPSWVILSGGWVLILLSFFYGLVEILGMRKLVFPLVVVGMNSIVIYLLHSLCAGWIRENLHKHLPETAFPAYWTPVIDRCGVLFVLWLICWWLYKQKAFIKL
ncbi:acyltransferase family protein [Prosthecobacter sp.]|uniref:acyltransferase family protein n=1 Tax=Prosthecobacter sp. TaxID=1965333 RepID=UPI003784161B